MEKLNKIQQELKAPKNQHNDFGGYDYRTAEGILNAVKPLLAKYECGLLLTDDVINIGNRNYVKASAIFTEPNCNPVIVNAFAKEDEVKKGMDGAQITGSASSYARKYALNGLFLIDDTKDPDFHNKGEDAKPAPKSEPRPTSVPSDPPTSGRVIGKIESSEDAGNGFRKYVIKGVELTTKKVEIIDILEDIIAKEAEAQVDYDKVVKGRFTNCYIAKVVECPPLPF